MSTANTTNTNNTNGLIGGAMTAYNLWDAYGQSKDASKQLGNLSGIQQGQWGNLGDNRNLILGQIADRAPTQDTYRPDIDYLRGMIPQLGSGFGQSVGNTSQLGDLIRGIGSRYQQEDDYLKQGIGNRINNLDSNLQQMSSGWNPTTVASHQDISGRANEIYDAQRSALMDVIGRVSSEGAANSIMNGMDSSTANEDMQRQIVQKYAPMMMQARVNSYDEAANHFQNQINTEDLGKGKNIQEMLALQGPALEAFMKMYNPRDAELGSTATAAELERNIASMYGDQFARAGNSLSAMGSMDTNNNNEIYKLLALLSEQDRYSYGQSMNALSQGREDYSAANQGVQSNFNQLLGNPIVGNLLNQGADWIGDKIGGWFGGGPSGSGSTTGLTYTPDYSLSSGNSYQAPNYSLWDGGSSTGVNAGGWGSDLFQW